MNYQIILFFFFASIFYVMLMTIKAIVTARSNSKLIVSMANAIAYGFYAIVIKQIATFPLEITITIIVMANLIGVPASMLILEKIRKDKIWKISVIPIAEEEKELIGKLKEKGFSFSLSDIHTKYGMRKTIDIFSKNCKESHNLRVILENYNVKYHFTPVETKL